MVTIMPVNGLDEALTSLKEMHEFYTEATDELMPIHEAPKATGQSLPPIKAPDLVITE